jgi:ATP-binding cassette, subfamily B, bacterial MsbA
VGLLLLLGALSALLEGIGLGLLVPVLQGVGGDGQIGSGNPIIDGLSQPFLAVAPERRIQVLMAALVVLTLLKNCLVYSHSVGMAWLRMNLIRSLRCRIFDEFLSVGYQYITERRSGDLYNDLVNETNRAGQALSALIQQIAVVLIVLVCSALLVAISYPLFLLVVVLLGLLSLVLSVVVRKSRRAGEAISAAYAKHASASLEGLAAMRTIRLFCREDHERERFADAVREANRADLRSAAMTGLMGPLSETFAMVLFAAILFSAAAVFTRETGQILPLLLTFLFILYRLMPRINQFNNNRAIIASNSPAYDSVTRILSDDGKPGVVTGNLAPGKLRKGLAFERVSFSYGVGKNPVLKDVSFEIPAGGTTAIVGASGAGKSTLVDLIPRFYDPADGRISADGLDIRKFDLGRWRSVIGVVSQDTFVFNASVRENIAYGRLEASQEEIVEACRRANALEFIDSLDAGFDTIIGDRGVRLSGGQRQRISIARAVLRNPEILILDEATSALDTSSERLVQEALEELSENRTVVVVAHRLSTIAGADQIVVLEDGAVCEAGPHAELLRKKGAYWRYHTLQYEPSAS